MSTLEALQPNASVRGIRPDCLVTVVSASDLDRKLSNSLTKIHFLNRNAVPSRVESKAAAHRDVEGERHGNAEQ